MKKYSLPLMGLAIFLLSLLSACTEDVFATTDPDAQRAIDVELINDYIEQKGYTNVDTSTSGVRYIILDQGDGAEIKPNDIVSYHFAARLTDDVLWATTIDTVASNNGIFNESNPYNPLVITYTADGWNIGELISGFRSLEVGYREGVAAVLGEMNVGGRARFIVPSGLAYAGNPPFGFGIPVNAILVFDIYPTYRR